MSKASIFAELKLQTREGDDADGPSIVPAMYQVRDAALVLMEVRHKVEETDNLEISPIITAVIEMLVAAGEDLEVIATRESAKG